MQAISSSDLQLDPQGTVMKLVSIQKHLDSKYQFDKPYSDAVINAELIFEDFLMAYNPDKE